MRIPNFKKEDPLQEELRGFEAALASHTNGHNRLERGDKARLDKEIARVKAEINAARGVEEGV